MAMGLSTSAWKLQCHHFAMLSSVTQWVTREHGPDTKADTTAFRGDMALSNKRLRWRSMSVIAMCTSLACDSSAPSSSPSSSDVPGGVSRRAAVGWPAFAGDAGSLRYSALDDITAENTNGPLNGLDMARRRGRGIGGQHRRDGGRRSIRNDATGVR